MDGHGGIRWFVYQDDGLIVFPMEQRSGKLA